MNQLIALRCSKCGHYNFSSRDGVCCANCGDGPLVPLGNASYLDKSTGLKVTVSVKDIDVFEKMVETLREVHECPVLPQVLKDKIIDSIIDKTAK